jgi:hypothetical protein
MGLADIMGEYGDINGDIKQMDLPVAMELTGFISAASLSLFQPVSVVDYPAL